MQIVEATPSDWPRLWPLVEQTARAGETYAYDPAMTSEAGRRAWLAAPPGATVVGRVPGAFHHPRHGYVALLVMFLPLDEGDPATAG